METIAYNFHDEDNSVFRTFQLTAGSPNQCVGQQSSLLKFVLNCLGVFFVVAI